MTTEEKHLIYIVFFKIYYGQVCLFSEVLRLKKFILLMGIILGLSYGSIGINVQAAHAEEYGIIRKQTRLYQGPGKEAADMGEISKGERVDIISILQDYVIIRYQNQYAYVLK